ncbi:unnamed protein product, partial [Meganyctiphanes norvegica]
ENLNTIDASEDHWMPDSTRHKRASFPFFWKGGGGGHGGGGHGGGGYGPPEIICKHSNTGIFSFFAFAILMLDITGDFMATIDISVDINVNTTASNATANNTNN